MISRTAATSPAPAAAASGAVASAVVRQDGSVHGSHDADAPYPALSLVKLYLGYWVLRNGAPEDAARVEHMIRVSDDRVASDLDRKYPQAIDEVARQFGLTATARRGYWGQSTTSASDVARFVHSIQHDPVAAPIIRGMRTVAPVAADGFPQHFGTALLPGAQGSKFGWSDDRVSATASVSFGDGWTAAAMTYGDTRANTAEALGDINLPDSAPGALGLSIQLGPWRVPAVTLRSLLAPYLPAEMVRLIPAHILVPVGLPR